MPAGRAFGAVVVVAWGQGLGQDLASVGVNRQMQLAQNYASGLGVLAHLPFPFAKELEAGRIDGQMQRPVPRPGHHALYWLSDLPAAIGADRDGNIAPETSARFRCNGSSRVGRPMTTICAWGHYGNRPAVRMAEPDSKD